MTPSYDDDTGPEDEDPWAAARARSRDDVRAAFAPRTATCPSCGATVEADGRRCPSCGSSLVATRPKWRPTARGSAIGAGVAALVVVAIVLFAGALREDAGTERAATAKRTARLVAAEKARLTEEGLPRTAAGPPPGKRVRRAAAAAATGADATPAGDETPAATPDAGDALAAGATPGAGDIPAAEATTAAADRRAVAAYRNRLVTIGEAAITADARARLPDDPPKGTVCQPTPDGPTRDAQERDPRVRRNRYECIAYERRFPLAELEGRARTGVFGAPYWLVADYGTGALTYCKLTPRGGEGAKTLANVPVDPACRDPFKRQSR